MRVKSSGIGFFLCLFLFVFLTGSAFSDTVNYVYDNLGRLMMVTSSNGEKIVYGYDEAGHIISVTRTSENQQPPMLTGITPQYAFAGDEASITITGTNLLTTSSVTTNNPGIKIINYSASANSVSIDAQVSNTVAIGPASLTVKTTSGSASTSLNLAKITLSPADIALAPGASETIYVQIEGLIGDYNLALSANNPDIISVPQSVTVPVTGTATFTISALSQGNAIITAAGSAISVFVSAPFIGAGTVNSEPVSVGNLLSNGTIISYPVSVQPGLSWGSVSSLPVSVKISQ